MSYKKITIDEACVVNPETYSISEKWPFVNYLDTGSLTKGRVESVQNIMLGDKLPSRARRKVKAGDILYSTVRPNQLHYGVIDEPVENMLVSTGFTVIRANPGYNGKYIYYYITQSGITSYLQTIAENSTSAYPSLKPSDIQSLEIEVPSIELQNYVVKVINDLDSKIELNHKLNQTLEKIAQAIFKSWFVDFDPVKAKIAAIESGQDPEMAAMRAISGKSESELRQMNPEQFAKLRHTASLFPDKLVETELGMIPAGWRLEKIEDKIDILNGFAFKSGNYTESGTFVLRTKNFSGGIVERQSNDVFLPDDFLISHAKYLCKPFDYHLVMVGASVGNRGLIFPHQLPALRNQNMWCFRHKSQSGLSQVFVKYQLDKIVAKSLGLASGSARAFFRKGDFGSQVICTATGAIQKEFKNQVAPLLSMQASLDANSNSLALIRNALMPRLLTGELTAEEAKEASYV